MSKESPDNLIKFCTAQAALGVLQNQSLRWSAPDCFEDPFELTSTTPLNFDSNSLLDSTIKLASSMIFAPESPRGDSPLINAIKRWRDESRFQSPDEAHGVLRELLVKMVEYRLAQLDASMSKWQQFVRNVRLCCFCAKPDNLTAWERFADKHKGVAFKFLMGENASFSQPRAVVYQAERPELTTLREQLGAILHNRKDNISDRFSDHFYIKNKLNKSEDEWRSLKTAKVTVSNVDENPSQWYEDIGFGPGELNAVYFGLQTDDATKKQVVALVKEKYSQAKMFQAVFAKAGFAIEFERVTK